MQTVNVHGGPLAGMRETLAPHDPVARALTWATMATSLSSGVFYTVSALFFTRVLGMSATTVGAGLTVAGAAGVAGSLGAGFLADRLGARRLLLLATLGQGLALVAYVGARTTALFIAVACCAVGLRYTQSTARQAVLARSFTGADRVVVRARLRVVTNVFIGLGTVLAGVALLVDTGVAYRAAMLVSGLFVLVSCPPLRRLARQGEPVGSDGLPDPLAAGTRGPSPLRDRRYLAVTGLSAVMAMHFGLQTVGVPLWVASHTDAPAVTVSALLVLNTVVVALFQVRAARGTDDVRVAGRVVARAGLLLALACAFYAVAGAGGAAVAVAVLVLAVLAHSGAEMWAEAGNWGLAFELADPRSAGAYQGVSQTGYSLGAMLAPLVVTATAIEHGVVGWGVLAAVFAAAGGVTWVIARRVPSGLGPAAGPSGD
ncbi:MFS transporter [Modestobacter sp. SYSU DS0290]